MTEIKVRDEMGHFIDIPEHEYRKMNKTCEACKENSWSKKYLGKELNYLNCPYDCSNDICHYRLLHPEKVRYE